MPLLDPIALINARIAQTAERISNHLSSASELSNDIVKGLLSLNNEELTAWLQAADRTDLFTAHYMLGAAINAATGTAKATLAEAGIPFDFNPVDIRPVTDKLADMGRVLGVVDGLPVVSTYVPPPVEYVPSDPPVEELPPEVMPPPEFPPLDLMPPGYEESGPPPIDLIP